MKVKKSLVAVTTALILLPILAGVYFWDALPDPMATHFSFSGVADRYDSKAFTVFGLPLILTLLHVLCILAVTFDRKNRDRNVKMQALVIWIVPVVSLFTNGMLYRSNLVGAEDITVPMMAFFGALFVVLGNLMPKIRQNHTIGIRLPWTVWGSEEVWHRTHRLGGKVWVICGLVLLIDAFVGVARVQVSVIALAAAGLVPTVYSYVIHKKLDNK